MNGKREMWDECKGMTSVDVDVPIPPIRWPVLFDDNIRFHFSSLSLIPSVSFSGRSSTLSDDERVCASDMLYDEFHSCMFDDERHRNCFQSFLCVCVCDAAYSFLLSFECEFCHDVPLPPPLSLFGQYLVPFAAPLHRLHLIRTESDFFRLLVFLCRCCCCHHFRNEEHHLGLCVFYLCTHRRHCRSRSKIRC